jgi:glycosyltransferase involved in cell wall biosynthesis
MTYVVLGATNVVQKGEVGGHFWVFAQYAVTLRDLGCRVGWLERFEPSGSSGRDRHLVERFRHRLSRLGLDHDVILYRPRENGDLGFAAGDSIQLERMTRDADLLLNFDYRIHQGLADRFRRRTLVDIDPGLLQFWVSRGQLRLSVHDRYFTTGETVGTPSARFPDCSIPWQHVRPPVCLQLWPFTYTPNAAAFTTVSSWWAGEWITDGADLVFENNKRVRFLAHADLPRRTSQPLELALALAPGEGDEKPRGSNRSPRRPKPPAPPGVTDYIDDATDVALLELHGWRVRRATDVAGSPERYQAYVRASRGEFSFAKPSCSLFQNAWISDRTLCYLASGKPAVVDDTGPSSYLPNGEGLFRFRSTDEAVESLDKINAEYRRQCHAAREIAAAYFDAEPIVAAILDGSLAASAAPPVPA